MLHLCFIPHSYIPLFRTKIVSDARLWVGWYNYSSLPHTLLKSEVGEFWRKSVKSFLKRFCFLHDTFIKCAVKPRHSGLWCVTATILFHTLWLAQTRPLPWHKTFRLSPGIPVRHRSKILFVSCSP